MWERLLRENIEVNTSMIFLSLSPNPVKRLPVLNRLAIFMAIWPVCIFQPMRHAGPAGGKSDQLAEFYEFKTLFLVSLKVVFLISLKIVFLVSLNIVFLSSLKIVFLISNRIQE